MAKTYIFITLLFVCIIFLPHITSAAECTKAVPANATLCIGDNEGLTKNVANIVRTTTGCTDDRKCEYICNEGYAKNGSKNECIESCKKTPLNAVICAEDSTGFYTAINSTVVTGGCTDKKKCQFTCNEGYAKNGSKNECISSCKKVPSNATMCADDNLDFTTAKSSTVSISGCTDKKKCEFECNQGYARDGNANRCIKSCKKIPTSATMCVGDNLGIAKAINSTVVTSGCTDNKKCEFECKDGYLKSGNNCVPDKCPDNLAPDLQRSDPACWTSVTTPGSRTCTWDCTGPYFACDDGVQGTSSSVGTNCKPYLNSCNSDCGDYGGCSNRTDFGHGSTYTKDTSTTSFTCYYTQVNEWSECDKGRGTQYGTSIEQKTATGKNCSNLNQDTTRMCGVCGPKDGKGSQDMPEDPGLCSFGLPVSDPELNTDNVWEWTCEGGDVNTLDDDVDCSAPQAEAGRCSSTYNGMALEELPGDRNLLCDSGVINASSITGEPGGPWTWKCEHFGDPINIDLKPGEELYENCKAPCFDYTIDIQPKEFYWVDGEDDVNVTVNINKYGACKSDYSCTIKIDNNEGTGESHTYSVKPGQNVYDVLTTCTHNSDPDVDEIEKNGSAHGNCIAKSCNAQGTCQGTPQAAISHDTCTSTCSSNADCSKGRMIETRP